jgi:hypothetical protein
LPLGDHFFISRVLVVGVMMLRKGLLLTQAAEAG